jgi:ribonuclease HI
LISAIESLSFLPLGVTVTVATSSLYVREGITQWIHEWKRSGWNTKEGQQVKNIDLWKRLDIICNARKVEWTDSTTTTFTDEAVNLAQMNVPIKRGSSVSDVEAVRSRIDVKPSIDEETSPAVSQEIKVTVGSSDPNGPAPLEIRIGMGTSRPSVSFETSGRGVDPVGAHGITVTVGPTVSNRPAPAKSRVELETFLRRIDLSQEIVVATDGASKGNPGRSGWGAVMTQSGYTTELHGGEVESTNNRMELMAAIQAIAAIPSGARIRLMTDSSYVKDGVTKWMLAWKRNGWMASNRHAVKNQDLWKRLDELNQRSSVTWEWVKGHNGHPMNERADQLAHSAIS